LAVKDVKNVEDVDVEYIGGIKGYLGKPLDKRSQKDGGLTNLVPGTSRILSKWRY
jgi:hypothetical protein